jgi:hypothetical protein
MQIREPARFWWYAIVFICLLLCSCAHWSDNDTMRQLAITGVIAIDCSQTHKIVDDPHRVELNPIVGPNPSHQEAYAWCAVGALATYGIAAILPPKWRKRFQLAVMIIEGGVVTRNAIVEAK